MHSLDISWNAIMNKNVLLLFKIIAYLSLGSLYANTDISPGSGYQISILTCDKSDATIYSIFGHSALRIKSKDNNIDRVYNYGTFNPSTSGFYTDFIRGKAKYFLSRQDNIQHFLDEYIVENRSVTEQVLNIDQEKIIKLMISLDQLLSSDDRYYYYDFIYNNCTTKLVEIIHDLTNSECLYRSHEKVDNSQSLRKVLSDYAENPILLLGLNLILGYENDRPIDPNVSLFLPDTLYQRIESAHVFNNRLMTANNKLAVIENVSHGNTMSYVYILIVVIALLAVWFVKRRYYNLIIWSVTGVVGILLLVVSIVTNIDLIQKNINILLLNPLFLFLAFRKISHMIFYIIILSNLCFLFYSLINGYFLSVMPLWLIISMSLYDRIKDTVGRYGNQRRSLQVD